VAPHLAIGMDESVGALRDMPHHVQLHLPVLIVEINRLPPSYGEVTW